MKTQRILGISWLMLFSFILVICRWQFVRDTHPYRDWDLPAYAGPILFFGAAAGFFLFRGAHWARYAVGGVTFLLAVLVACEIWQMRFWPRFDGYLGIAALISAIILLSPRRPAVVP
jgi:hypothetical protein